MARPIACAVMLTHGTTQLAQRAIDCFQAQRYPAKRLMVLDTSPSEAASEFTPYVEWPEAIQEIAGYIYHAPKGQTIGALRNEAAQSAIEWHDPDILLHWDDDDWSSATRMEEQVEALEKSKADVTGYTRCLFWRSKPGEAWLYKAPDPKYVIGASMCYWTKTWRKQPFADLSHREDGEFQKHRRVLALDAYRAPCENVPPLVCEVHGANFGQEYYEGFMSGKEKTTTFQRASECDQHLRRLLK